MPPPAPPGYTESRWPFPRPDSDGNIRDYPVEPLSFIANSLGMDTLVWWEGSDPKLHAAGGKGEENGWMRVGDTWVKANEDLVLNKTPIWAAEIN